MATYSGKRLYELIGDSPTITKPNGELFETATEALDVRDSLGVYSWYTLLDYDGLGYILYEKPPPKNEPDYVYTRADGGKIKCYGKIEENSSFSVVCRNEAFDGITCDIDTNVYNTWKKVCGYLDPSYRVDIEEIETC